MRWFERPASPSPAQRVLRIRHTCRQTHAAAIWRVYYDRRNVRSTGRSAHIAPGPDLLAHRWRGDTRSRVNFFMNRFSQAPFHRVQRRPQEQELAADGRPSRLTLRTPGCVDRSAAPIIAPRWRYWFAVPPILLSQMRQRRAIGGLTVLRRSVEVAPMVQEISHAQRFCCRIPRADSCRGAGA